MIKSILIFTLYFVAINASGEFSILSSPKSISFKGSDVLESQYVGDVLSAALGYAVSTDANWGGLIIKDPFDLPKGVVAMVVDGVDHVSLSPSAKTYELEGSHGGASVNELAAELEPVCNIDFNHLDDAVASFRSCFGDIVPNVEETKNLKKSGNAGVKQFLQAIAYVNAAADNLSNMLQSSNFLAFHVPLKAIVNANGAKSDVVNEALKLVSTAVAKLNTAAQKSSQGNALVVVVSQSSAGSRIKRETVAGEKDENNFNLAKFYSEDYPVIFNIILWFMVVFGLSLLAICYAIGSMDPGRDSIIYRMTSTRMKKDN